ncbi:CesT family type III secretion system chaperone [Burkholderia dolosa]|uniref:CesT family type III secretion system chaperone n=1 Tax=Burkholderia dolosa TaxID=152500 RepID=UPI001B99FB10|nr:CesT family type III secretion system chaperone [Burkholderia dolosa]MBR8458378.1 CesT family type III secretion system chaperone [Burkholderia dolosa]
MNSITHPYLARFHQDIGLTMPADLRDIDLTIRVDGRHAIRIIEYPSDFLVLCAVLDPIAPELLPALMQRNLLDEDVYPCLLAIAETGGVVIWRRLDTNALDRTPLLQWFEDLVQTVESVQEDIALAHESANKTTRMTFPHSRIPACRPEIGPVR